MMNKNQNEPNTTESVVPDLTQKVLAEMKKAIVGKREVLENIFSAFLAGGHVLLEDYPGLAKTLIANSFADVMGMSFHRIQFTPDLLPGDITGGYVYDRSENAFVLRKGPIFANIILADEINRASPRTQSALLEAMQEKQVTLEGVTMPLPDPFIVIATQNPIEYEGTFPLPEAQLDRFLVKLSIGYPSKEEEAQILTQRRARGKDAFTLGTISNGEEFLKGVVDLESVYVDADIEAYIVDIIQRTRNHRKIAVGASPRGSLALLKLARAWAAMHERTYVLPDDVRRFVKPVLSHRIILDPDLWAMPNAVESVMDDIISAAPVPVLEM
ncbi:MAG: MoxR family ATPase [Anaerolineae bacterium]|jgi:MoxR-like ATPase|nr:MoxR family ATPase [Anaerolineae bacterium]